MKIKRYRLLLFTIILIGALAANVYQTGIRHAYAATTGLVSYWKFDEGGGTAASDSSGSNAGTLQGNATWGTGQIGSHSLKLDGSNNTYVDIPTAVVNTSQSFSVSAWVNLNSL